VAAGNSPLTFKRKEGLRSDSQIVLASGGGFQKMLVDRERVIGFFFGGRALISSPSEKTSDIGCG
jgi:hypothetical protein